MDEKENFGYLSAKKFTIGDIVEWTTWDSDKKGYNSNYGILINIENKVKSNRIISVSTVKPINEPCSEIELFTLSLKLVDSMVENNNEIE